MKQWHFCETEYSCTGVLWSWLCYYVIARSLNTILNDILSGPAGTAVRGQCHTIQMFKYWEVWTHKGEIVAGDLNPNVPIGPPTKVKNMTTVILNPLLCLHCRRQFLRSRPTLSLNWSSTPSTHLELLPLSGWALDLYLEPRCSWLCIDIFYIYPLIFLASKFMFACFFSD